MTRDATPSAYDVAMRRMRRALLMIVAAAVLCVPGQAFALTLNPPGQAGANQYSEVIPTSVGNASPPQGGASNGHALAHLGQGAKGSARLSHLGKTGAAAAALAAATAPTPASNATAGAGKGAGGGSSRPVHTGPGGVVSQPQGSSSVSALVSTLTGSDDGGLGLLLPLLLVTGLVVALGVALLALRRRDRGPGATA